jgi:hypothetical protein
VGDDDLPVVSTNDTFAAWQSDQNGGHRGDCCARIC